MAALAQTIRDVLEGLRSVGDSVSSGIISDLIEAHADDRERMLAAQRRYDGAAPIHTRTLANPDKVNNRLAADFVGDVVDTKSGYMGDIVVEVSKRADAYSSPGAEGDESTFRAEPYEEAAKRLRDWRRDTHEDDLNAELVTVAAIAGYGVKRFYVTKDGQLRSVLLDPWEVVIVAAGAVGTTEYALHYYEVEVVDGPGPSRTIWHAWWYDTQRWQKWEQRESKDDAFVLVEQDLHMLGQVPLIRFANNRRQVGDCDKVLDLIDGYDRTLSDVNSEVEQLRLAYLYLKGHGDFSEDDLRQLNQTGVFPIEEDGDVGFITKNLDDAIIEHHLDRLGSLIMRFAKSVDFGEAAFGGDMPIIAYQIKVASLEQKSMTTERKFTRALREQYDLVTRYWRVVAAVKLEIDPHDLTMQFNRNLPMNIAGEVDLVRSGRGNVSLKTLLGLVSFVDDADAEIELLRQEEGDGLVVDTLDDFDDQDAAPE